MRLSRLDPEKGYLSDNLYVPKKFVNCEGVKNALTFTSSDDRKVDVFCLWKETATHLVVPRNFWAVEGLPYPVVDLRPTAYEKTGIKSAITLDLLTPEETIQQDALAAMEKASGGILQLRCGAGKTLVALELGARLGQPILVIVDTTQLLVQWKEKILQFLEVSAEDIGLIQGPALDWKRPIVLATYKTLGNLAETLSEEVRRYFGLIVFEEAHHVPAHTFAKTADLFYGYRLGLTATPTRVDGRHVINDFHLGPVLYKNLKQELRPDIRFLWTGFELDPSDNRIKSLTEDRNGELHLSKLSVFFGQWRDRLEFIIDRLRDCTDQGRKVLVLANSIAACVNMLALWLGRVELYTDIPYPTPQEVGESLHPLELDKRELRVLEKQLHAHIKPQLRDPDLNPVKKQALQHRKDEVEEKLQRFEVWKKTEKEYRRRQRVYLSDLLEQPGDAGLMIGEIKPEERQEMLRTKQIIFAISKYGKEALDEPHLDTLAVTEPMAQRNGLQQALGRILRKKAGKKVPLALFFEDQIGPMIGMCKSLRGFLRTWPAEEGGPFDYSMVGHPHLKYKKKASASWTR